MSEKNTDKSRATGHAPIDFQPFHSAVNRIPLLRKKAKSLGNKVWNRKQKHRTRGQLTREQTGFERERTVARNAVGPFAKTVFHDGVAEGHDLLKPDRWSGSIDVEMTVHTPLVFGKHDDAQKHDGNQKHDDAQKHDGAQSNTEENSEAPTSEVSGSHRSKECEDDTPEEPFISPTMVKGMISRAYETLTASRFRVFGAQPSSSNKLRRTNSFHRAQLTYRADPASALMLVPVRVEEARGDGSLKLELLRGTTPHESVRSSDDGTKEYSILRAAALPECKSNHIKPVNKKSFKEAQRLAPHRKRVRCTMTLCFKGKRESPLYAFWVVTDIFDDAGKKHCLFKVGEEIVFYADSATEGSARDAQDDSTKRQGRSEKCRDRSERRRESERRPGESEKNGAHNRDTHCKKLEKRTAWGYAYRTAPDGKSARQLFKKKHDERFFFKMDPVQSEYAVASSAVHQSYKDIIASYLAPKKQEKRMGENAKSPLPNRFTGIAGERKSNAPKPGDPDFAALKKGDLAYAVLNADQTTVRELVPVMIGRHAYSKSPWELAKDQKALPLSEAGEASAADRLFGYVVQKTGGDEAQSGSPGDVALRGRIEFGPIDASGPNVFDPSLKTVCKLKDPHPLPPLLEPKPSSARRFITDEEGKTPFAADAPPSGSASTPGSAAASGSTSAKANAPNSSRQAIARSECFSRGQFLGIAAYPVHRCRLGRNELPSAGGQVLANGKETEKNAKVSLAVDSFIQAGSVLRCQIRFTGLAQEELAALLWVLTPENLVPQSERNKHAHAEGEGNKAQPSATKPPIGYLRMGLGKPFGLGAIEARATSMTAHKGEDLAERYKSLDGCLGHMPTGPESPSPGIADFSSALDDYKLDEQPWVQAMQRAAYGYDDGVKVRYMSLDENKTNNQTDKKGNPKRARLEDGSYEERGVSPTDLFSPGPDFETYRPAPISISVTKKNDQKNRNGQRGHKSDTKDSRRGSNNNSTRNGSSARRSRRKRGQTR